MRCPRCLAPDTRVLDSRPTEEGMAIRRRRECQACGERFTTYEKVEVTPLLVIKKDGRREAFDRDKVLRGMLTACEKRPVELERLQAIAAEIERELQSRYDKEVESRVIGEMVMERLRRLDQVAYVRFASVYRQFKDLETFRRELDRLLAGDEPAPDPRSAGEAPSDPAGDHQAPAPASGGGAGPVQAGDGHPAAGIVRGTSPVDPC
ncbi:transcriptional repressor NrdR [Thermaerobacter sp. PB12/4term]|uniref:transcriptional regulator NrdR n=1 Tax=Thermaerobacter sp. PB12/4term TaxID=2293838 RepID=UPI000E32CC9D|nr:transcriptional repressor NrdR [Thermaerobacter sp. PB12/4term]